MAELLFTLNISQKATDLHTIVWFLSCSWRLYNRLIFLLNMLLNQQMSAFTQRNIKAFPTVLLTIHTCFYHLFINN